MSKEGRKFESIVGFEPPEEEGKAPDGQDIEHGSLVLKLKGEEPLVFDILTKDKKNKIFLVEFFMEFANTIYESLKEENDEGTQTTED